MRIARMFHTAVALLCLPLIAHAQAINTGGAVVGGVAITTDGFLQYRQVAPAPAPAPANRKPGLLYISLPRALDQWRAAKDAGKAVNDLGNEAKKGLGGILKGVPGLPKGN